MARRCLLTGCGLLLLCGQCCQMLLGVAFYWQLQIWGIPAHYASLGGPLIRPEPLWVWHHRISLAEITHMPGWKNQVWIAWRDEGESGDAIWGWGWWCHLRMNYLGVRCYLGMSCDVLCWVRLTDCKWCTSSSPIVALEHTWVSWNFDVCFSPKTTLWIHKAWLYILFRSQAKCHKAQLYSSFWLS